MIKVAIFGAGQIGRAVSHILGTLVENGTYQDIEFFNLDSNEDNFYTLHEAGESYLCNVESDGIGEIVKMLVGGKATHVINALPFSLNEKVASAAMLANCSYIDFTEDDVMADKVQALYRGLPLNCAVKCGLAPGFINYIGYDLVSQIHKPGSLMISVGALPRTVSYDVNHPEYSYNLSWSVDGLVNEYIRPCRIRRDGELREVPALGNLTKVVLDGVEYEAAYTSGGVGSLAKDLKDIPNIAYMTLRYPGHYKYVRSVVQETYGNFDKIKKIFLEKFPYTNDDVIVVYANALGQDENGHAIRRSYANKFYGVDGLTGIQSTTASAGVAVLELMLNQRIGGMIDQTSVPFRDFVNTEAFKKYYKTK